MYVCSALQAMQKKFVTNLAFLLFLNLLIKPFWILGIDRTVQNTVGAEVYGQYFALFNFSFLLNILLDMGITNFNNRNIAQHNHLLQKHISGIISLRLALAVIYFSVSWFCAWIIGYEMIQFKMLLLLLVNQIMISFILYLRSNLSGLHLFKTDSMISVLDRMIMIVICSIMLWGNLSDHSFRIEWFIWAQTAAYILTSITGLLILIRKSKMKRLTWRPLFALSILKKSYPFAVLILLMTFYNRIDSVMIERLLPDGSRQAGIYAQAFRILDAASMIAFLYAGLLLPIFSRMIGKKEKINELLRLSYSLLVIPAFIIGINSFIFRNEIMNLLYHEHIESSSLIFGILMTSYIAICTTYIYGTLLTANGNLRQLNLMAAGAMALNIILNLILIPKLKAEGAAYSGMITQFITATIQAILAYRIFKLTPDRTFIASIFIFVLSAIAGVVLIHRLDLIWTLKLPVALIFCFIICILLKLIKLKAIYQIVRYGSE